MPRLLLLLAALAACNPAPRASRPQQHREASAALYKPLPERDLTQGVARSLQLNAQTNVRITSDGAGYLACWIGGPIGGVQATRLAADGTVLDAPPISVSAGSAYDCGVAFDGVHYAVVYETYESGTLLLDGHLQLVSAAGALVGAPITVAVPSSHYGSSPTQNIWVGCNPGLCAVEWTDMVPPPSSGSFTYNVYAELIDTAQRAPVGSALLLKSGNNNADPHAATPGANGSSFLAVVDDATNSSTALTLGALAADGGASGLSTPCQLDANYGSYGIFDIAARPGGHFYLTLPKKDPSTSGTSTNYFGVAGSRATAAGALLDGCANLLYAPGTTAVSRAFNPKVAWSGSDWLVSWRGDAQSSAYSTIDFVRVSDDTGAVTARGTPLYQPQFGVVDNSIEPACAGDTCALAWADFRVGEFGQPSARAAILEADGGFASGDGQPIALGANGQRRPSLAWDGQRFFAAWSDFRNQNLDVYAAHLAPDGTALEPTGIPVSLGPLDQDNTSAACSGDTCLVAFTRQRVAGYYYKDVAFARVLADGGLPDPDGGVVLATLANHDFALPQAAAVGGTFLVAWSVDSGRIDGALVNAQTGAVTGPFTLAPGATNPAVAASADKFLVAWSAYPAVQAKRIALDGGALDPSPIVLQPGGSSLDSVRAASDGTDFFVAWGGYPIGVGGRTVLGDGGAPGPMATADVNGYQVNSAAHVSDGWLLTWIGQPGDAGYGVATGELDGDGGVFNTGVVAYDVNYVGAQAPALASSGPVALLAFERGDPDAGNVRAHTIVISAGAPQGSGCSVDTDCATRHCTDGVCCDTACGQGDPGDCMACATAAGAAINGVCGPVAASKHLSCRASAGDCDVAEECDGVQTVCPADAFAPSSVICRAASGQCDAAETCTGSSPGCPADLPASNGIPCAGGDRCFQKYSCQSGACVGAEAIICAASDACHAAGTCQPATGLCTNPAAGDGAPCDDHDACTGSSTCVGGVCTGRDPVSCAAPAACRSAGVCDSSSGNCSYAADPDGTNCDDGDACTAHDACVGGACAGKLVVCTALDECHEAGTCSAGACSNPAKTDGATCSGGGTCQSGACKAPPASSGGCQSGGTGWAWLGALLVVARGRRRRAPFASVE